MSRSDRLFLALLLVDALLLAVVELMFLPLRFDGDLLPYLLGGMPLPVSALLALATTPWLVSMAATLSARMLVASAPLVVWLLTVGAIGITGPGGDVVMMADWRALLLFACGALPSAVVLGRVMANTVSGASPMTTGSRARSTL